MKRTDAEAIEDIMALRLRLEHEAQIARLRVQRSGDAGARYAVEQVLAIAGQIKTRLVNWHKQAVRRKKS